MTRIFESLLRNLNNERNYEAKNLPFILKVVVNRKANNSKKHAMSFVTGEFTITMSLGS